MWNILVWKLSYLGSDTIMFICVTFWSREGLFHKNVYFSQLHHLVWENLLFLHTSSFLCIICSYEISFSWLQIILFVC